MDVLKFGNESSKNVLIQIVDTNELDFLKKEYELIKNGTKKEFLLIALKVCNWNSDLSPWEVKNLLGRNDFIGNAKNTLEEVLKYAYDDKNYILGGYSLAGLFSLYAAYNTNKFIGIVSASPSVWYPNFLDYALNNDIMVNNIYLSLGDKEAKTKNEILNKVEFNIIKINDYLLKKSINSKLEFNLGNHFKDYEIRMSKGFIYILNQME